MFLTFNLADLNWPKGQYISIRYLRLRPAPKSYQLLTKTMAISSLQTQMQLWMMHYASIPTCSMSKMAYEGNSYL